MSAAWRSALSAVALLLCGLLTVPAQAQSRRTAIALVTGGADPELHARLLAELRSLGWRVREIAPGSDVALAQVARRAATLAVLRVGRGAEGVEVWVAPEVDAEARSEWIDVDTEHPEVGVLRAVETLRARFLELGLEPEDAQTGGGLVDGSDDPKRVRPPVEEPRTKPGSQPAAKPASKSPSKPATPATDATPAAGAHAAGHAVPDEFLPIPDVSEEQGAAGKTSARGLWLGLAGGLAAGGSDMSATPALTGSVRYVPVRWFGVDLSASWTPAGANVSTSTSWSELRGNWIGLAPELRYESGGWALTGAAGCALAIIDLRGHTSDPALTGRRAAIFTGLPFLRAAGEVELAASLRVRIEALAGISAPRAVIVFQNENNENERVAVWGRPLLAANLGLQWGVVRR